MLRGGIHDHTVGEEVGCFLGAAGFHNDVPFKLTVFGKGLECPDAGRNHTQAAAHKHIPVAHAALLGSVGLHVGNQNPIHQSLGGFQVFGGVDGEFRFLFVQQGAAVLGGNLEEFVIGDGLPDAEGVLVQRPDRFRGSLEIVLGPVIGGIGHTGFVEQILVVDQNHVGEALGQAELLAAQIYSICTV